MRKHYLDNLRWATVLLVLIYHIFYIFNGVGILGGIPNAKNLPLFDALATLIYPWFMVLLFIISGACARYTLDKKTSKEFIKERATKLIIPSTLGLFVIHWWTGYLNIKIGGGLEYIPKALVYPISVISGSGPLWFIQLLFIFSCILVPIKKLDKDRLWNKCKNISTPVIYLMFIAVFLSAQILNMPLLTVYRFGIYFVAFLVGYFMLSHDAVQEKIERSRWWSLGVAIIFAGWYAIKFIGTNFTDDVCLKNLITNIYLWFMVLTILGFAKKHFSKPIKYMTKSSFGIYILHYPVLISICYLLTAYFDLSAILNYVIAFILEFVLTFGLYEIIKRIPVISFLAFGLTKNKK